MSKFQDVRVQLGLYNMTISSNRTTGEYRVNYKGGTEETAYYTNDLTDALNTGLAMAKERDRKWPKRTPPTRKPTTGSAAEELQQLDIEDVKNSAALLPTNGYQF